MFPKSKRYMAIILTLLLVFSLSGVADVLSAAPVDGGAEDSAGYLSVADELENDVLEKGTILRIPGLNRYETSANIAAHRFLLDDTAGANGAGGADTVILARGDDEGNFADGLASSVLAGALNGPILLTRTDSLPDPIIDIIGELGAQDAVLLGGLTAISDDVGDELEEMGLEVRRIGGSDRYETAAMIAEEASELIELQDYAFIVNGTAVPDALVAGASSFKNGAPILQVRKDSVPTVTAEALAALAIAEVYLVGDKAVLSDKVESSLDGLDGVSVADRMGGINRFETCAIFGEGMFPGEEDIVITSGYNESLADAVGAGVFGVPIFYVQSIPPVVENYLRKIITADSLIRIIGGPAAVGSDVEDILAQMIEDARADEDIIEYTVTFDGNEGEPAQAEVVVDAGETVDEADFPVVSREGYEFVGWNTESDGSGDDFTAETAVAADITVYAIWEELLAAGYTVTFDGNEGEPAQMEVVVDAGETVDEADFPAVSREGYEFVGWNTESDGSGDDFTAETAVVADITVYAIWEELPAAEYTVTFDGNGGTPAHTEVVVVEGETVDEEDFPAVTRVGYNFVEWNTESDGSGEEFTAETVVMGDTIVYAIWVRRPLPPPPPETYEVTFEDPEGGELTAEVDGSSISSGDEVEEGSDVEFTVTPMDFCPDCPDCEDTSHNNLVRGVEPDVELMTELPLSPIVVSEWRVNGDPVPDETNFTYTYEDLDMDIEVAVDLILEDGYVLNVDTGCWGTQIQQVINYANTEDGHLILVGAGEYEENVFVYKDITLRASQKHQAVVKPVEEETNGDTFSAADSGLAELWEQIEPSGIDPGIGIYVSSPWAHVEDFKIDEVEIGIKIFARYDGEDNSTMAIKGNKINSYCEGILAEELDSVSIIVEGNEIENECGYGIRLRPDCDTLTHIDSITVMGNTVEKIDYGAAGIRVQANNESTVDTVNVSGNTVLGWLPENGENGENGEEELETVNACGADVAESGGGHAINVRASDESRIEEVIIDGNLVEKHEDTSSGHGIRVHSGYYSYAIGSVEITDNEVYYPGCHGIRVQLHGDSTEEGITVTGNTVVGNEYTSTGIRADSSGTDYEEGITLENVIVEDNTVTNIGENGDGMGIRVQAGGYDVATLIENASVRGNTVTDAGRVGIRIHAGKIRCPYTVGPSSSIGTATVEGNTVSTTDEFDGVLGIRISAGDDASLETAVINNNEVSGHERGIFVRACDRASIDSLTIEDNEVMDNHAGIFIDDGTVPCPHDGNSIVFGEGDLPLLQGDINNGTAGIKDVNIEGNDIDASGARGAGIAYMSSVEDTTVNIVGNTVASEDGSGINFCIFHIIGSEVTIAGNDVTAGCRGININGDIIESALHIDNNDIKVMADDGFGVSLSMYDEYKKDYKMAEDSAINVINNNLTVDGDGEEELENTLGINAGAYNSFIDTELNVSGNTVGDFSYAGIAAKIPSHGSGSAEFKDNDLLDNTMGTFVGLSGEEMVVDEPFGVEGEAVPEEYSIMLEPPEPKPLDLLFEGNLFAGGETGLRLKNLTTGEMELHSLEVLPADVPLTSVFVRENEFRENLDSLVFADAMELGEALVVEDNDFFGGDATVITMNYVFDDTWGAVLDLDAFLANNTYDPPGEIITGAIIPFIP